MKTAISRFTAAGGGSQGSKEYVFVHEYIMAVNHLQGNLRIKLADRR